MGGMVTSADPQVVLSELASTPIRLEELSRALGAAALAARPAPDEWSATEILAHLRANADVWGASIQKMLDADHPTIRYVSPRGVMKKPEYMGRGFKEALDLVTESRRKLLDVLRSLPPEAWSREARFTGTTRGRDQTVMSYARRIAEHEAVHVVQFEEAVNQLTS